MPEFVQEVSNALSALSCCAEVKTLLIREVVHEAVIP
jgi:hypothetical protein